MMEEDKQICSYLDSLSLKQNTISLNSGKKGSTLKKDSNLSIPGMDIYDYDDRETLSPPLCYLVCALRALRCNPIIAIQLKYIKEKQLKPADIQKYTKNPLTNRIFLYLTFPNKETIRYVYNYLLRYINCVYRRWDDVNDSEHVYTLLLQEMRGSLISNSLFRHTKHYEELERYSYGLSYQTGLEELDMLESPDSNINERIKVFYSFFQF